MSHSPDPGHDSLTQRIVGAFLRGNLAILLIICRWRWAPSR